jgi:alpha-L-rhamnosidase
VTMDHAPSLLLDFGREVAGRLLIRSACDCTAKVMVSYGESVSEALNNGHYLGENLLTISPHGVARGPKSGFRYAWIHVLGGAPQMAFRSIEVEGIAYPVTYAGSFVSSDARLNTIWKTAAYTAHLCMQDGVWDAPKRDRGWWAGDLDVSGPVIEEVFGDTRPLKETLTQLLPPKSEPVNGIPGYTALWITSLASVYRQDGNMHDLQALHAGLLQLLAQMDAEFDGSGNFLNRGHRWLFVDWSPGLFESTPQAVTGTEMQFLRGYRAGAWLLKQIGDDQQAQAYEQKADTLQTRLRQQFQQTGGLYSGSPQLNALAVLSGVADAGEYAQIWKDSLSNVGNAGPDEPIISPYFNDYLLQAMTEMGHRQAALDWVRSYWGGMIDEGATSFWEAYDLRWPRKDPHTALQADGRVGYYVSLAHGWSSGPAAWLLEEILGIHATEAAFHTVTIRPDLLDLQWVRGSVATPHGAIGVAVQRKALTRIELTLPAGIAATVLVPVLHPTDKIVVNGVAVSSTQAEGGARASILLRTAGQYTITSR